MRIEIDRELAQKHLNYLGYQPGEAFLRFFYHSSDDRKKKDKGRKENGVDWETIENHQTDGRGVYIVVNGAGGGHTDADITQCCAIFCEWDDIPLAEQFEKWSEVGFVEPTFTIFSGDKSMQPYWLFEEPIAQEQWRELQVLLIHVMEADESNKNPSRVFRLAGAWHVKPDREPIKTEIVGEAGIRYSYSDLRDRLLILYQKILVRKQLELQQQHQDLLEFSRSIPATTMASGPATSATATATATLRRPEEISQRYKDITVPVPVPISLQCGLGKPNKEFLNGVATLRNTSMATLARDLIGVQSEFSRLGQVTNEDAYTLFLDACRRCSPGGGWDEQEWEQIWNSAVKSNPIASISKYFSDGIESCIKGEYWRFLKSLQLSEDLALALSETETERLTNKKSEFNIFNSDDKMIQDYKKLAKHFGKRIRLNKLSKRIEIDGKPVSLDRARIQLAVRHGILVKSGREDVQDILTEIAEEHQYSPIEEYLSELPVAENTSILENLAQRYFGVTSPMYEMFVRKTLIGAVKRTFEPGCKMDNVLILQGKQGYKKSTFFKVLAGNKYFDDSLGAVGDKDERLKLHRSWFIEWSELESVFKRRDVSATKAFLSTGTDAVRPPYCRDTQDFDRPSIIVATTNKEEFLADETGNRRFWIIPVKKRIDTKLLREERDAIWAAAVLAYRNGEECFPDYEEEEEAELLTEEFQTSDPWEDFIINYIEHRDYLRLSDLLTHLQVDLSRQERSHQMRCSAILKKMGWEREFRMIGDKRVRVWCKIHETDEPADRPQNDRPPQKTEVDREVDHLVEQGSDRPDQPDRPFSKTFQFTNTEPPINQNLTPDLTPNPTPDPIAKSTNFSSAEPMTEEDFSSFGKKVDRVDRVDQMLTQQGLISDQPHEKKVDRQKSEVDQQVQQFPDSTSEEAADAAEEEDAELIGFIRFAIAENDSQFAKDIQAVLRNVCSSGAADRQKVWGSLSEAEKAAFLSLISPTAEPTPESTAKPIPKPTAKPTAEPTAESFKPILSEGYANEPTATPELTAADRSEVISEEDAEKIREIATVWWPEYYPEQLQNLLTQMYGWKAPGTKYCGEIINQWLEKEDDLVRDRINQLISTKTQNLTEETHEN